MQHWLLITSRRKWERLKVAGAWAFPQISRNMVSRIAVGDEAAVYVTKEDDALPSAVVAVVRFTGGLSPIEPQDSFDRSYPVRVPFSILLAHSEGVPFAPLVPNLAFITNKHGWGAHLQGQSLKPLQGTDYAILRAALDGMPP